MSATKTLDERVADVKARPYQRELVPEEGGGWFARIAEFPGCVTEGDTPAEALENLDDAMEGWVRTILEDGEPIPDPFVQQMFSGKTVVRLGASLHRDAAWCADRDGISLNQFITLAVARSVGSRMSFGISQHGTARADAADSGRESRSLFNKSSIELASSSNMTWRKR